MADRKISDLTALTTPAAGDYLPIVDISESVASSKNKRITIEELFRGIPLGTAAAPSIAIEGDENTGIYSPGADQLAISTGGSGRLFVNSSGVVTTDTGFTSAKLNVVNANTVSTFDRMLLLRSDNLSNAFLGLGNDSFYIASATSAPIVFCTNSDGGASGTSVPTNERLRITSAGLVGVGTSNPGHLLHLFGATGTTFGLALEPIGWSGLKHRFTVPVSGDTAVISCNYNGSAVDNSAQSTSSVTVGNGVVQLATGGINAAPTTRLHITAAGLVGVGTSSPQAQLQVLDRIKISDSTQAQGSLQLGDGASTLFNVGVARWNGSTNAPGAGGLGYFSQGTANSGGHYFYTGDAAAGSTTLRMTIAPGGSVGIGTSAPLGALSVGNHDNSSGQINDVYISGDKVNANGHYARLMFRNSTQSGGSTASVRGERSGDNFGTALTFYTQATGSAGDGTEKLRITPAGNVGIGTTSPGSYNANLAVYSAGGAFVGALHANASGTFPKASAISLGSDAVSYTYTTGGSSVALTGSAHIAALQSASSGAGTDIAFINTSGGSVSEKARIDSSGRLGIGVTTVDEKLHVDGNIKVQWGSYRVATVFDNSFRQGMAFDSTNRQLKIFSTTSDSGGSIAFLTRNGVGASDTDYGTERLRITSAGLVGIGTSAPGSNLDVRFGTSPATDNGGGANTLRVWTSSALAVNTGGAISLGGVYNSSNNDAAAFGQIAGRKENATNGDLWGYLQFATNTGGGTMVERMRITGAGNVGIGTSTPAYNAHITNSGAAGTLSLHGSSGIGYLLMGNTDSSSGPVVISSANQVLAISRGNSFSSAGGGTLTESVRIDSSGRVGIGTTSPSVALDVNGNGSFKSSILVTDSQSKFGDSGVIDGGAADGNTQINFFGGKSLILKSGTERARIDSSGRLLVGTSSDSGGALLQVNGDRIRVATAKTPASATDTGTAGEICWDANYIYVCTATNTWKRTAIATW